MIKWLPFRDDKNQLMSIRQMKFYFEKKRCYQNTEEFFQFQVSDKNVKERILVINKNKLNE